MDLSPLLRTLRSFPAYQELLTVLGSDALQGAVPLPRAARPVLTAALAADLGRPLVYLTARSDRMHSLQDELPLWIGDVRSIPFPEPNPLFYEKVPWGPRTIRQRAAALAQLTASRQPAAPSSESLAQPTVYLASARAVMTRTLALREIIAGSRWLTIGSSFRLDQLLKLLIEVGYLPATVVTHPGQFSRRGGILDLWPPMEETPLRIEFFGDEIESLRRFEPATQRSTTRLDQLRITPAREGLPRLFQPAWEAWLPENTAAEPDFAATFLEYFLPLMNPAQNGFLDLLPSTAIILVDDFQAIEDLVAHQEEQAIALRAELEESGDLPVSFPLPYLTLAGLHDALEQHTTINLGLIAAQDGRPQLSDLGDHFLPGPRFGGQLRPLIQHLGDLQHKHESAVIVSRQAPRLVKLWRPEAQPSQIIAQLPDQIPAGEIHFLHGALSDGWTLRAPTGEQTHLLTDAEVFGWSRPAHRRSAPVVSSTPEAAFADLQSGDTVVHVDYGVGRFAGLVERSLEGIRREYLLIEYAAGDQLYVPIHQADRVARYVGVAGGPSSLSRLGSEEWQRSKNRARKAVEEVARDLLELYAQRMQVSGHAFAPDGDWQRDLEAAFPYIETEDQQRALEAVKFDMEQTRPMDRLICGDAGYGKTEVALRAAFKAVMDGKQVAMLVPTTVLAQQHYNTFRKRLASYPLSVEMLSRFRSRSEANQIVKRLADGEVDIVIGTHRLLQPDIQFKDLGLLILDEEQRFGVTHKEYFKRMRTEVDVLTLTATPIPRTLYMSLTGVRDISTINTPPEERLPPFTHVGPYEPRLVRQSILREIDRGGQVFFVHNRVQSIGAVRQRIENLVPEARLAVAHGQMPETQLAQVMDQFNNGEIDVLLSTSIIESGLDIPNANTLIVDQADMFGLSQLYQLRGRVGRSAVRAYAYFFRHAQRRATEEALQRLEFLAEHTQLGAGYSIAMRDLEMRGAGEILGTRQHGHISAIGFHLYTRLLSNAVHLQRAAFGAPDHFGSTFPAAVEPLEVSVDLPLPVAIPEEYIADRNLRLQLYRRLANLRRSEEIDRTEQELGDRFGELPAELHNLFFQVRIKLQAAAAGVEIISHENEQIFMLYPLKPGVSRPDLGPGFRLTKRGYWLGRDPDGAWKERIVSALTRLQDARSG